MKIFTGMTIGLCALLMGLHPARARERYEVHWREQTRPNPPGSAMTPESEWIVWLRDNWRQKTLWSRTIDYHFDPKADLTWSKDHRALAVSNVANFWVWRAGYQLRNFASPSDYMMGFAWSPDNRRLLARSDGSGASDIDYGGLYCLELGAWPRYKIFRVGAARSFGWDSPTKVRFTEMDEDAMRKASTPGYLFRLRHWRVPRTSMFAR